MNNDTPADAIKALQEDMALISATYLKLTADAESDFKDVDAAMDRVAAWTRTTSLAAQDGLVEALQFYANHLSFPLNAWVQPTKVDYSMGGDGHWPDGPPIPSSELLADQGKIARKALSAIKGDKS